ncbi:MAG TPA: hypothetical protein GXZ45_12900 [Propionibacterium sp.]|nr:hypothetical protein [Propionibacterium sp.]
MPVPTCTPEFGGEPFPCTESDLEAQQKLDARYAEAERVLRRNVELENEMFLDGSGEVSSEARSLYDPEGPYLDHWMDLAESLEAVRATGEVRVLGVSRAPIVEHDAPATLALVLCVDGSGVTVTYPDGESEAAESGARKIVFTETEGPRIWTGYDTEDASCPAG